MQEFTDLKNSYIEDSSSAQDNMTAIKKDFWICLVSREASLLARKEVLGGKAKFGITGDGKELPQIVAARFFEKGDFRSGYYRDQTMVMALGLCTIQDYFAQLYSDTQHDPFSGGRQMNNHFATPFVDDEDNWLNLSNKYNITSDISPTAGQMARALGLALASKKFRDNEALHDMKGLSTNGNEVIHCTIGDASTSEGIFWETMNAATVMDVPMVVSVWDDGYGISVPKELQTAKGSISEALSGLLIDDEGKGIYIFNVKGHDYVALNNVYDQAIRLARKYHKPVLVHVEELTQPQGHSTSGSHERYKSKDRLEWERNHDCLKVFEGWILDNKIMDRDEVEQMKAKAKTYVKEEKKKAWSNYINADKVFKATVLEALNQHKSSFTFDIEEIISEVKSILVPQYEEVIKAVRKLQHLATVNNTGLPPFFTSLLQESNITSHERWSKHLYSETSKSAINQPIVHPTFDENAASVSGFQVINEFFDKSFEKDKRMVAFGEDVGQIGDVNQGFAGLQEKYGSVRVFDTGIREWSIMGQAIGLAMRGLRPIAEIQYLDYLIYGLAPLSDDLATLRYRTNGMQMAPAIIRTRGHRLEGIWHSGSHLGMIVNALRGMYICVPRNLVQAAGMYQTLLQSSDPALVIEPLAGYRLKEKKPNNIAEYSIPLGVPDILTSGDDITIVSYGMTLKIIESAMPFLEERGISVELIDVQTFIPFDLENVILNSIKKTNRLLIVDEDVPGGGSAYLLQKIIEEREGYFYLDSMPQTLTAKDHRPPYGDEGDYFCKPNREDIIEKVLEIILEAEPNKFK